jgi:hypothetical protein
VPDTFGPESKIREVLARLGERGRELLRKHGYDVGEGFVDVLSQYQSLEHAWRTERLRDLKTLVAELNSAQ